MKNENYLIKVLMSFFISVTFILIGMFVLGSLFDSQKRFGYEVLLSPLIFGASTTIPSLVTYSKRELTTKQLLFRVIMQIVLIEGIVLFYIGATGGLTDINVTVSTIIVVLLIYAGVTFVQWLIDIKMAKEFNFALKQIQGTAEE